MTARCLSCSHHIMLDAKEAYGTGLYFAKKNKLCHLCQGHIERVWRCNIPGIHPLGYREQEQEFAKVLHHRVYRSDNGLYYLLDKGLNQFIEHPSANLFEPLKEVYQRGKLFG